MRHWYRWLMVLLGLGVAVLGVRVLMRGQELVRIIVFLLGLGVGIAFMWEGLRGWQRGLADSNAASGLALGFSLLPLACYGLLLAYACYAWSQVGHWPHYNNPDPKQLPHGALMTIAGFAATAGLFSMILVPSGFLVRRLVGFIRKKPMPWPQRAKVLFLTGAALWSLDMAAELSRLPWSSNMGWLAD